MRDCGLAYSYEGTLDPPCSVRKGHPRSQLRSGRLPMIVVDDTAEYITAFHRTFFTTMLNWYRTLLLDPLVWPSSVVVLDILQEHPPQVPLTDNQ